MRPGKVHGGQLNVKEGFDVSSDCDGRRSENAYRVNREQPPRHDRSGRERGNLSHSPRNADLYL
jgi:hypothetical protein